MRLHLNNGRKRQMIERINEISSNDAQCRKKGKKMTNLMVLDVPHLTLLMVGDVAHLTLLTVCKVTHFYMRHIGLEKTMMQRIMAEKSAQKPRR